MPPLNVLSILQQDHSYIYLLQQTDTQGMRVLHATHTPPADAVQTLRVQVTQAAQLFNQLMALRDSTTRNKVELSTDFLQGLGQQIYQVCFPPAIQQALKALPAGAHLSIITHDTSLPWELAHNGDSYLALTYAIGRQIPLTHLPMRPLADRQGRPWTSLLIGNPTGDLPQSSQEIQQLANIIETTPGTARPRVLLRQRATKTAVLQAIGSGAYDLIHYSGHVELNASNQALSGLVLAGYERLTALELQQNLAGKPAIFFNGCNSAHEQSGRGRSAVASAIADNVTTDSLDSDGSDSDGLSNGSRNRDIAGGKSDLDQGVQGLASALIQGGVQTFVGTQWPILDAAARDFVLAYYQSALQGDTIGEALRLARRDARQSSPLDPLWASYTLYGDPRTKLLTTSHAKHKPATLLAASAQNLAALFQHVGEEAATAIVEKYITRLTAQIIHGGGQVYNLGHDMLFGAFGLLATQENDAEQAVNAALKIMAELAQQHPIDDILLEVGLGISSGNVYAQTVNMADSPRTILMGSVAQEAAHLANHAAHAEILITEPVHRLCSQPLTLILRPLLEAEDIAHRRVFQVLGIDEESTLPWVPSIHQTPMVSRLQELQLLQEAWQRCQAGRGQIVDIVGEAGIGKSRLLQEFHKLVGEEEANWLIATCSVAFTPRPYALISQLLYAAFDLQSSDGATAVHAKIRHVFQSLSKYLPTESQLTEHVALLSEVLELPLTRSFTVPERLADAAVRQHQLVYILGHLLVERAVDRPLIIALDDLHKGDEASLAVLSQLIVGIDRLPILVVTTFRVETEWQPPWHQARNRHLVRLDTLSMEESQALLCVLLENSRTVDSVPDGVPDGVMDDIVQLVLSPAQGNPFFLREWITSLRESGALYYEQNRWQLMDDGQPVHIPESVERLIRIRVESLPEFAQRLLPILAVTGDSCEYELLRAIVTETSIAAALDEACAQLETKEIIYRRWGETAYYFNHSLFQSIVYNSLRGEEQRRHHRRIGQAIEALYADNHQVETLARLAHHYYRGMTVHDLLRDTITIVSDATIDELATTISYLQRAGERANHRFAPKEAIVHFQRALEVAAARPLDFAVQQPALHQGIGDAYDLLGQFKDAVVSYKAAYRELVTAHAQPSTTAAARQQTADLARRIGRLYGKLDQFEQAHDYMRRGLRFVQKPSSAAERETTALIHTHTGSLYYLQQEFGLAKQACLRALALLDEVEANEVLATVSNVLGVICEVTGDWTQAVARYEQSRDLWLILHNQYQLAEVMDNLGTLYFYRGEFDLAEEHYQNNVEFWRSMDAKDNIGSVLLNLGSIYVIRGDWPRAHDYYQRALAIFQAIENPQWIALTHNNLGILELACGHNEEALAYFRQSCEHDATPENLRGLSEVEVNRQHFDQALAYAEKALTLAQEADMPFETGTTLRALGRVSRKLGEQQAAQQHLEQSLEILDTLGARYELGRTHYQFALLAQEQKDKDAWQHHLQEAIAIFIDVGAGADLRRAQDNDRE